MNKAEIVFEKLAEKKSHDTWKDLVAGAGAGLVSTTMTMPLENLQINQATRKKQPVMDIVKSMYKAEGPAAFYKGIGIKLLKVAPTMALTFATYPLIKKMID
jgi:hypothetical protein